MKIIKINAVWCPGCLSMKKIWKEISEEYNYNIIDYDFDIDEDELKKYNVGDKLPVVIKLDDNEEEIERLVGEKTKEELLEFLGE